MEGVITLEDNLIILENKIGIIEGVAMMLEGEAQSTIFYALEVITSILDVMWEKEKGRRKDNEMPKSF